MTIHTRLIRAIAGSSPWPTGHERITTLRGAILWRLAGLPGLDAEVRNDGTVHIFRGGPR